MTSCFSRGTLIVARSYRLPLGTTGPMMPIRPKESQSRFAIKPMEGGLGTTVVDAKETPWSGVILGARVLDRDEALNHPRLTEVFHVVDHIIEEDPVVYAHFSA
jgi:hypothetical protein